MNDTSSSSSREYGDPTGKSGFGGTGIAGKWFGLGAVLLVLVIIAGSWVSTTGKLAQIQTQMSNDYKDLFAEIDGCVKKVNFGSSVATANSNAFKEALLAWATNDPNAYDITSMNKAPGSFGFPALVTTLIPNFTGSLTALYEKVMNTMNDCTDVIINQQRRVNTTVAVFDRRHDSAFTGRIFGGGYPNDDLRIIAPGGKVIASGEEAYNRMSAQVASGQTADSVRTGINEGPAQMGGSDSGQAPSPTP